MLVLIFENEEYKVQMLTVHAWDCSDSVYGEETSLIYRDRARFNILTFHQFPQVFLHFPGFHGYPSRDLLQGQGLLRGSCTHVTQKAYEVKLFKHIPGGDSRNHISHASFSIDLICSRSDGSLMTEASNLV